MPKRLLLIAIFALLPLAASAADTAPPAGLGPDTTTGSGGSNADAGSLQPAGTSPIQAVTPNSANLTAPSSLLQGSAPSGDSLKVLDNEADGPPHTLSEEPDHTWSWIALILVGFIVTSASIVWRDRRRFRHTAL